MLDLTTPDGTGKLRITSVSIESLSSTYHFEGPVEGYGLATGTATLTPYDADESRGAVQGEARVLGNDGGLVKTPIRGTFRREGTVIQAYFTEAKDDNNSKALDSIQAAIDNLSRRRYLYALNFASTHGDNVIAPFIALTEVRDANIILLDTVASKLTEKVRASKYGLELIEFIATRKAEESKE